MSLDLVLPALYSTDHYLSSLLAVVLAVHKTPRIVRDNLFADERKLLKELRNKNKMVYMWEAKGPSFLKMTVEQYIQAGENELSKRQFYQEVGSVSSEEIKQRNDIVVNAMIHNEEISEKVG